MTPTQISSLDDLIKNRVEEWLNPPFDKEMRESVKEMLSEHQSCITNAFYTRITFGTGGMRGLMGPGTNRINRYTISFATEGLARYLRQIFGANEPLRVYVGFDCRHHSLEFAEEAASVLAGHGIEVFLSEDIVCTPFTSFACRELHCHAAVMITASHNPKEYNGYKVYSKDGGQIIYPHDVAVEEEASFITSPSQVKKAPLNSPLIERVGNSLKKTYIDKMRGYQLLNEITQKEGGKLKIVFANLHGTGSLFVVELLKDWGFTNVNPVVLQEKPDGSFPTVNFPNPEEPAALDLGIQTLLELKGDILIATDPDADRMRVGIRVDNSVELLNGNQIASLLLYHLLSELEKEKKIPSNGVSIKTIVTTELFRKISEAYGVECIDVLTGFKYIGQLIHQFEDGSKTYLFGGEESYGTLRGTLSRDKDGVLASAMIAEAGLVALLEGKTLRTRLDELFARFGHYSQCVVSLTYPESKVGHEEMKHLMELLRTNPPSLIHRIEVEIVEDYLRQKRFHLKEGTEEALTLPLSDVLIFTLKDQSKIVIRPSGTEPKIKIYGESIGDEEHCRLMIESFKESLKPKS